MSLIEYSDLYLYSVYVYAQFSFASYILSELKGSVQPNVPKYEIAYLPLAVSN